MLPISCYNVFGNAYYAAFGESDNIYMWILDFFVEFLYLIDLGFNFTQEYLDDETYVVISEFTIIAKRYLLGNFIFDFLAWVPFNAIFPPNRLFLLFKLLRIPRIT